MGLPRQPLRFSVIAFVKERSENPDLSGRYSPDDSRSVITT